MNRETLRGIIRSTIPEPKQMYDITISNQITKIEKARKEHNELETKVTVNFLIHKELEEQLTRMGYEVERKYDKDKTIIEWLPPGSILV